MKLTDDQWMDIFGINCVYGKSYVDDQDACVEQAEIMLNDSKLNWNNVKAEIKVSLQNKYPKP